MTENRELEAAIAAGINSLEALIRECVSYRDVQGFSAHEEVYQLINGYRIDPKRPDASKAFAAYREQVARLQAENARLRDALRPFAEVHAAYERDYNSDTETSPLYEFVGDQLNWFGMWMQHDGYKVAKEADYQQAAALADVAEGGER